MNSIYEPLSRWTIYTVIFSLGILLGMARVHSRLDSLISVQHDALWGFSQSQAKIKAENRDLELSNLTLRARCEALESLIRGKL